MGYETAVVIWILDLEQKNRGASNVREEASWNLHGVADNMYDWSQF